MAARARRRPRGRAPLAAAAVGGLRQVWADDDWVVYAFDNAVPLVDPPLRVTVTDRTTVRLEGSGTGVLRIRWSRWLSADGPGCIRRHGDAVEVQAAGGVTVGSSLRPHGRC